MVITKVVPESQELFKSLLHRLDLQVRRWRQGCLYSTLLLSKLLGHKTLLKFLFECQMKLTVMEEKKRKPQLCNWLESLWRLQQGYDWPRCCYLHKSSHKFRSIITKSNSSYLWLHVGVSWGAFNKHQHPGPPRTSYIRISGRGALLGELFKSWKSTLRGR